MGESKLFDKFGKFTVVPNSFIEASRDMSPSAFRLFIVLRYHSGIENDEVFPSYETLRAECNMSYTTISKAIQELMASGWIKRRKRFSGSTTYILQYPSPPESGGMEKASVLQKVEHIPPETGKPSSRKRSLTRPIHQDPINKNTHAHADSKIPSPSEPALMIFVQETGCIDLTTAKKREMVKCVTLDDISSGRYQTVVHDFAMNHQPKDYSNIGWLLNNLERARHPQPTRNGHKPAFNEPAGFAAIREAMNDPKYKE